MRFLDPKAIKDWIKSRAVNSMMTTEKGFFMDARQGPVIREELDGIQTGLDEINSKLINIKTLNFNGASGAVYINIMLPTIVLFASCTNSGYYTQLFLNIYGMWHVYLYKVDGSLATEPVDVTIVVGSI